MCARYYIFFLLFCTNLHLFWHLSNYFFHSCMFGVCISEHVCNTGLQFLDYASSKAKYFSKIRMQCHL
jgi:hypothetical protein